MRRHDAGERAGQPLVGPRVVVEDVLQRPIVDRDIEVAVGDDEAMPGEVLAAAVHAGLQQAMDEALRQQRDHAGVKLRSTPQARSSAPST